MDAMDEILALQQELAAVQEEDTTHRLSERYAALSVDGFDPMMRINC